MFHMTIKFHYLLHIADRSRFENPRMSWCYSGESLMMHIRDLVASSCRGLHDTLVANKVMKKYAQALSLELERERGG